MCTDLGDMAGKPDAVSLEPEIVSKKGKIPRKDYAFANVGRVALIFEQT